MVTESPLLSVRTFPHRANSTSFLAEEDPLHATVTNGGGPASATVTPDQHFEFTFSLPRMKSARIRGPHGFVLCDADPRLPQTDGGDGVLHVVSGGRSGLKRLTKTSAFRGALGSS